MTFPGRRLRNFLCWTFLVSFFVTGSDEADGPNGCYKSSWTYYYPSHSCFKLVQDEKSWSEAEKKCGCFNDPIIFPCHKGWLARIQDKSTNDFIKDLLPSDDVKAHIGLYKDNYQTMTWDGMDSTDYGDDQFLDFGNKVRQAEAFDTAISKKGWEKMKSVTKLPFICQQEATNDPMTIECPRPMRAASDETFPVECGFDFSDWTTMYWHRYETKMATCHEKSRKCTSHFSTIQTDLVYDGGWKSVLRSSSSRANAYRNETDWTCTFMKEELVLGRKSCDVIVYEPATNNTCSNDLTPKGLRVECVTERIFPPPQYKWFYKNQGEKTYTSVPNRQASKPNIEEMIDGSTGDIYFRSEFKVYLQSRDTVVKKGNLTIKLRVSPDVGEVRVAIEDRRYVYETFYIERPSAPIFKFANNATPIDVDLLTFKENDKVHFLCEATGGVPLVEKTGVSCDFNLRDLGNGTDFAEGPRYNFKFIADRANDGASCYCMALHITGQIKGAPIKFNVLQPSEVIRFMPSQQDVDEDQEVTLTCLAGGNPGPTISILTSNPEAKHVQLLNSTSPNNRVSKTFNAQCLMMGSYECISRNELNGRVHESRKSTVLRIKCPPTSCQGDHHVQTFVVNPSGEGEVTLCALGFPIPDQSKFTLFLDTSNKQVSNYEISLKPTDQMLTGINIKFNNLTPDDMSQYKLYYPGDQHVTYSYIKFNLSAEGPPLCPSNVMVQETWDDYATLTFNPGYSYSKLQTVEIVSLDGATSHKVVTTLAEVEVHDETSMTLNISGLTPNTEYWFGIYTSNQDGNTSCLETAVNTTTLPKIIKEERRGSRGVSPVVIAVAVIVSVVIIIVFLVVIYFILKWNRNKKAELAQNQPLDDANVYSTVDGQALVQPEHGETSMSAIGSGDATSAATDTEVQHPQSNVYNNDADLTTHGNPYANNPVPETGSSPDTSGRVRNEQGLVYVDVVIKPTGSNQPRVVVPEDQLPQRKKEPESNYVTIDPVATLAMAKFTEAHGGSE